MKKIILAIIILILLICMGTGIVLLSKKYQGSEKKVIENKILSDEEEACINSGGEVIVASCCESIKDFPNNCLAEYLAGNCSCLPTDSHEIKICDCAEEGCFDGQKCLSLKEFRDSQPDDSTI